MKTRELILRKAITLVERDGSAALSMRHLANEVHVTPMALYRHYASRDALLEGIANHYFAELAQRWQSYTTDNQYEQTLMLIGLDLINFYLDHPHIYQLMFIEPRVHARDLSETSDSSTSPTFSIVVAAVQQGITAGELHGGNAQEIALTLAGQLHGLAALHGGGRITMSPNTFREFCRNAFIRAINAYKVTGI